jgi:light-harvesting complex I chlorophyll a/b binding protein 3
MLGVLGCLAPEILGRGVWWDPVLQLFGVQADGSTAAAALVGSAAGYGGAAAAAALLIVAAAEWCRLQDYRQPGSMGEPLQVLLPEGSSLSGGFAGSGQAPYPGGPLFNFANYVTAGPAMVQFKESEVKHGRLAMLAMLGFAAQALLTEEGPWENLREHIASPVQYNMFTEFGTGLVDVDFERLRPFAVRGEEEGAGLSGVVAAQHWWDGLASQSDVLGGGSAFEAAMGRQA